MLNKVLCEYSSLFDAKTMTLIDPPIHAALMVICDL